jgi:rubrerythrin
MSDRVRDNLAKAFAAESKASVRTRAFALKALSEGHDALARLFSRSLNRTPYMRDGSCY